MARVPPEHRVPLDTDPAFTGGGRHADLPADWQQRQAADADYRANIAQNTKQDRDAVGQPKTLSGTPWVRGSGRHAGKV